MSPAPARAARRPPARPGRENRTRYVVLGMLTIRPMTGYALKQQIAGSVGHFWQESFGQLYPALRALAADGMVRAARAAAGARGGATWEITPRGREALAAWLAQPPVLEPRRSELLLKIFFAGAVPAEVTLRNLDAVAGGVRAHLAELQGVAAQLDAASSPHPDAPCWRLTLDFGLRFMTELLDWIAEAQRVIGARGGRARGGGKT